MKKSVRIFLIMAVVMVIAWTLRVIRVQQSNTRLTHDELEEIVRQAATEEETEEDTEEVSTFDGLDEDDYVPTPTPVRAYDSGAIPPVPVGPEFELAKPESVPDDPVSQHIPVDRPDDPDGPDEPITLADEPFIWEYDGDFATEAARELAYAYNDGRWYGNLTFSEDREHIASIEADTGLILIDNEYTGVSVDAKYVWGEFLCRSFEKTYIRNRRTGYIEVYSGGVLVDVEDEEEVEELLSKRKPLTKLRLGDRRLFRILQDAYFDFEWDGSNVKVSTLPYGWNRGGCSDYENVYARLGENSVVYVNNVPMYHVSAAEPWIITDAVTLGAPKSPVVQTAGDRLSVLEDGVLSHYRLSRGCVGLDTLMYRVNLRNFGSEAELINLYPDGTTEFTVVTKMIGDPAKYVDGEPKLCKVRVKYLTKDGEILQ